MYCRVRRLGTILRSFLRLNHFLRREMSVVVGLFPLNYNDIYSASAAKANVILDKGLDGKFPLVEGSSSIVMPSASEGSKIADARSRAVVLHSLSNLIRSNKASYNSIQALLGLLNGNTPSVSAAVGVSAQNDIIASAFPSITNGLTNDVFDVLTKTSKHSSFTSRVALASVQLVNLPVIVDVALGVAMDAFQVPKNAPIDLALGDAVEMPAASLLACVRRLRNVVADSKLTGADKEVAAALEEVFATVLTANAALSEAADALSRQSKTSLKTLEGGSDAFRKNMVAPSLEAATRAVLNLSEALDVILTHQGTSTFWTEAAAPALALRAAAPFQTPLEDGCALLRLEAAVGALEGRLGELIGRGVLTLKAIEKDQHARALEKARANPKVDVSKLKLKRLAAGKGVDALLGRLLEKDDSAAEEALPLIETLANGTGLLGWKEIVEEATASFNQETRRPKLAKGTQDFNGARMAVREEVFDLIKGIFRAHGAVQIDTPVFELKETLTGKYGEDSKLIYDLKDQGGEALALRYDLTVPFARYLASNAVEKIKRFHIGKVYRRDEPQMSKGRFREFYQCDFDVAGQYDPLLPEAEVLTVMQQILGSLNLGEFEVKINHRKLLNGMMTVAGVEAQKHRPICSAIDKLDKESWETVKREMVEVKGLAEAAADKLGQWVGWRGTVSEICAKVEAHAELSSNQDILDACQELRLLEKYLTALGHVEHIVLDLSLARGLDYYTGLIYEAVLPNSGVGSVAAGGRYDGLVGMFSGKQIPAVGMSIGVERVFSVMERRLNIQNTLPPADGAAPAKDEANVQAAPTDIMVCSLGGDELTAMRLQLCMELWRAGVSAELPYKAKMHPKKALEAAIESGVPMMAVIGEDEAAKGTVRLRAFGDREEDRFEKEVPRDQVVAEVKAVLAKVGSSRDRLKSKMGI